MPEVNLGTLYVMETQHLLLRHVPRSLGDSLLWWSHEMESSLGGLQFRYFSHVLAGISILNALLCFTKKKRYRMFESNIEVFYPPWHHNSKPT